MPLLGVQSTRGAIATPHAYSEAEPYWTIEMGHHGAGYGVAILGAAEALVALANGFVGLVADAGTAAHRVKSVCENRAVLSLSCASNGRRS